jgi:hypothetical protein
VAGNVQSPVSSQAFTVVNPSSPYVFQGFSSPVDNPSIVNQANAGQAVPFKWRITRNGVAVSDPTSFVALSSRQVPCNDLSAMASDVIETYAGGSGLIYNGDGNWHYNWKTPKLYGGTCRVATITLNDGSTHDAYFKFK